MTRRLILDISSLARWSGPPVGIARVEHALATSAMARSNTVLSFYDARTAQFRRINPKWQPVIVGWSGMIDIPNPTPPQTGWRAWMPSRGPIVARLERWRLTLPPALATIADRAQRAILAARRHGTPVLDAAGQRVARVPPDLALGEALTLGPNDILFTAGSGWAHLDPAALATLKARHNFRYATLCYDLIPITHPQFWLPESVRTVGAYWRATLPIADLVIVTANCIAADVAHFAQTNGIPPPPTAVLPLGFDPPPPQDPAPLPASLTPGQYAPFVSTLEPRKGHATLLAAWRTLVDQGIPQRQNFHLVFVGRPGWMIDDVLATLADPALQPTVLHLPAADQAVLDSLYDNAAFCLYPSIYEGFGLPPIEAFARGKAVLASTGGAVPETVGALSPCLPPGDAAAWATALAEWIEHPETRAPWEARIRAEFNHPHWITAADAILDRVSTTAPAPEAAKDAPGCADAALAAAAPPQ